jgi:hypothetical protein
MPLIKIKCKYCFKDFVGFVCKTRQAKYCSHICSSKGFVKEKPSFKCETCGSIFKRNRSIKVIRYCSTKCIRYIGSPEKLGTTKNKGFWKSASYDEKLLKVKSLFERDVIKTTDCWKWKKMPLPNGYNRLLVRDKTFFLAHRVSWMITYGLIPKNTFILHKCDNPGCTNPEHLFLGTPKDNSQDMIKKGRHNPNKGQLHYNVKLKDENVIKIKELISQGISQNKLGKMFNVSPSAIQNIADGKTWKHLLNK